jgi:hypothetical protein
VGVNLGYLKLPSPGSKALLPAFAAEFIAGLEFIVAFRANRQQCCSTPPAEFVVIRILNMTF